MPYLFHTAVQASELGLPSMRAMVLEFPEDPTSELLDRQYMLGESLLVAPIFNEEGKVSYYLPAGKWTNFLTGEVVEGGSWRKEQFDFFGLPLFVRPNSIIALGANDVRPDYDYADGVTFELHNLEDGRTASTLVRSMQGETEVTVSATRNGSSISVKVEGSGKPFTFAVKGLGAIASVTGAELVDGVVQASGGKQSEFVIQLG
jgi:alpha-D-xyloside xylohydrolase